MPGRSEEVKIKKLAASAILKTYEDTCSHSNTKVKQLKARTKLGWETAWELLVLEHLRLTESLALEKSTVVANLLHLAGAQITKSGRLNLKTPKTRALGNYQFCRNDVKLVSISLPARYVIKHQVQRSIGEMELGSIRCKHNVTWQLLSRMKDRLIGFKKTLF